MANALGNNPAYIEATATSAKTGLMNLLGIYWVGIESKEIVADNDFLLVDSSGGRIAGKRAKGNGDGLELMFKRPFPVDGFNCTALDAGVVYIYYQ